MNEGLYNRAGKIRDLDDRRRFLEDRLVDFIRKIETFEFNSVNIMGYADPREIIPFFKKAKLLDIKQRIT